MENKICKSSSSRNSMWIQAVKTFCPKNSSLKSLFWKSLNWNEFHRQVTVLVYVNEITTEVLWDTMDTAFAKQRNNTFDRYQFSMRKQLKCQSVDFFLEAGKILQITVTLLIKKILSLVMCFLPIFQMKKDSSKYLWKRWNRRSRWNWRSITKKFSNGQTKCLLQSLIHRADPILNFWLVLPLKYS